VRKTRTLFTIAFCLLAVIPLLVFSLLGYESGTRFLRQGYEARLMAERDRRAALTESWLKERLGNARLFAGSVPVADYLARPSPARLATAQHRLADFAAHPPGGYRRVYVVSPTSGRIVASSRAGEEGQLPPQEVQKALRWARGPIGEAFRAPTGETIVAFIGPVPSPPGEGPKGVVIAETDLQRALMPVILNRSGLGKTGESLLVNRDGLALTELRYRRGAPLRLRVGAEAARRASRGESGIVWARDYRGVPVAAAYSHVPLANWGLVVKQDQQELYEPVVRFRWLLLGVTGASILVAAAVAVWMARRLTRPLDSLAQAAGKLTDGEVGVCVDVDGTEELNALAQTFNLMVARLEEATRNKDEFVRGVTHDLKGPLAPAGTYLDILLSGRAGPLTEEQMTYLTRCKSAVVSEADMVDNMLEATRIKAGRVPYEPELLDLREPLAKSLEFLALIAPPRQVGFSSEITEEPLPVRGEARKLERVFNNLLANAVRYNIQGGRVTVRAWAESGRAIVSVADTGVGIAPQERERIFERFYQVSGKQDGSGLGLGIVKAFVDLHGGRVRVESEPGRGSTFFVDLPLAENV